MISVQDARSLPRSTSVRISGSATGRAIYGIHAGQVVALREVQVIGNITYLLCECEDEHVVEVLPRHASVVR